MLDILEENILYQFFLFSLMENKKECNFFIFFGEKTKKNVIFLFSLERKQKRRNFSYKTIHGSVGIFGRTGDHF